MTEMQVDSFRADMFRTLSHPLRIKILRLLRSGEKNVTQLQDELDVDASVTSQHLMALRSKNMVFTRKSGNKVYYTAKDPQIYQLLDLAREIFNRQLTDHKIMLDKLEKEDKEITEKGLPN